VSKLSMDFWCTSSAELIDTCGIGMIVPANILCTNKSATLSKPLDSGAFKIDVGIVVELRINGAITKMRCLK
jgi:hypothetical protein